MKERKFMAISKLLKNLFVATAGAATIDTIFQNTVAWLRRLSLLSGVTLTKKLCW
jgi:hypothetical protein